MGQSGAVAGKQGLLLFGNRMALGRWQRLASTRCLSLYAPLRCSEIVLLGTSRGFR